MFPLDDNFVFGDIFFCGWYFFLAEGQKKKYSANKKKYSPTDEVTHPTETPICLWYDVFMPPPLQNSHLIYSFLFPWLIIFFSEKNVPSGLFSTGHISFYFKFPPDNRIFFLPLRTFRSFWRCEKHDFFLKKSETWYFFLIVIFFFFTFLADYGLQKKNLYQHLNKNINFGTFRFSPVLA